MTGRRIRIVLCTSGGICGTAVLDGLLASGRIELAGLIKSSRILRRDYSPLHGALEQIRLTGLPYAFALWCSTSGADALGNLSPTPRSVTAQAARRGIPNLITKDLNDAEGHAFLEASRADLLVSAFFNQRIGTSVCALCGAGGVNIHPSLLPEFKGVDPVFFSRLRDTDAFGVTIHRLAPELDCGNLLLQEAVAVPRRQSIWATTAALYRRGAGLLVHHIDDIVSGIIGTPQPSCGDYDSWPTPAQVRKLRRRGIPLFRLSDFLAKAPPAMRIES